MHRRLAADCDEALTTCSIPQTVQLVLDLEFPILCVQPAVIDFGVVADGDTRKMYFSVSHTSSKPAASTYYSIRIVLSSSK